MSGPIALPASNNERSGLQSMRDWFNKKKGKDNAEETPLLGGSTSRKSTRKVITIAVASVVALGVLGTAGYFIHNCHDGHKGYSPTYPPLTETEKLMLELPSNDNIRGYLKTYTSEAHLAGTESDKRQAEWTRDQFQSFGLDSTIETYWPMLNYPISHRFGIVTGPEDLRYEAKLTEDVVDEDETSKNPDNVPLFHGYSKNGTVTGRVVYANYGRVEDFQFLKDSGIELNGTIALVRYGGSFRGLKVRAAETFGCVGALIYSDPIDDGPLNKEGFPYTNPAKAYPEGPWRSKSSAQRGSVQYLSLLTGDPLTPGYAATEDAVRLDPEDSPGLTKIPSLPLSYEDALPILKATQGHGVRGDKDWSGGLEGVGYFSGPTEGEAILTNHIENKITPIWNVITRIEGTEESDKAIVLGNHRDAWVYGAVDPSSGSAAMMELARVFGELLETGWRPRRTIILASWDAEEYGLVGSTEWVEDHKEWLDKEGAVYINVDTAVSGPHFSASASPSLNRVIYDVTSRVSDPKTGKTIYETWGAFTNATEQPSELPTVGKLGSGSDFVAFLDFVGISSVNIAFGGDYGVYHSNYDSFHWMEKFGDPDFTYHQTLVKIWGLLTLRLADDLILPLYPGDYANELSNYVQILSDYSDRKFPQLAQAVSELQITANKFEKRRERLESHLAEYSEKDEIPSKLQERLAAANKRLTYFERGLIDPEGIQGREWFKHVVYAPGLYTGYSSQVFPAIADGIDAGNDKQANHAEERAALSINHAREWLKKH